MADKKQAVKPVKTDDDTPTPAQAAEMRGQVQDMRNEKAAKDYEKRKSEGKSYKKGGSVRGDGCAKRGKTKGRMI